MKRITLLFIAIIACFAITAAQADTIAVQGAVTETRIEYTDTPADPDYTKSECADNCESPSQDFSFASNMIPIVAIVCCFGIPVSIVFIVFYFNNKDRKAKYKLAEQALAAGQPIPEEFLKGKAENILRKGITNVFTGIGLFIFLWALTDEFNIGCVGLLIMFIGFGQLVIHYMGNRKKEAKNPDDKA
jgi:hypothetical protein